MSRRFLASPWSRGRSRVSFAYTLTELMVIVAILGIMGTVSTLGFLRQQQDESINSVAVELAGWLSSVQRAALRGRRCDITLSTGSLTPAAVLARATEAGSSTAPAISNGCLAYTPLYLSSVDPGLAFTLATTTPSFSYTPRGTVYGSVDPMVIRLELASTGHNRCLKIEGILGLVLVGRMVQGTCQVPA